MMQQQMVSEVDVDKSGRLDKYELRKLIRMYWEKELKAMQNAFVAHCDKSDRCMPEQVEKAFRKIAYVDGNSRTPSVPSDFMNTLVNGVCSSFLDQVQSGDAFERGSL